MKIIKFILLTTTLLWCTFSNAQIQLGNPTENFELDYGSPKEYEIGGLKATGVRFLDPNALISITGLKVGDKITIPGEAISKAINKLWEQKILGDIKVVASQIEGDYIFLDFQLTERPRLSKFKFNGVRKSEADDIRESIRLIRGKVVTDAIMSKTRTKIKNYYTQKGYRNATIDVVQQNDSLLPNSVILDITVRKNDKVKIGDIVFKGNEHFEDGKLKRKMKDTKERKIYHLFKASKMLNSAYTKDKQSIINFYNTKGYRDAEISFDTFYNATENLITIEINISEGPEYVFGNITWVGNFLYSDDTLNRILNIRKGLPYSKDVLDRKLNFNPSGLDITSLYMDEGYLFFNIVPVELRVDSNQIDIEMRMYEGEQATIKNILISGNSVTSDHVIRREIFTLPGQKFSRSALIRSQQALSGLGYFNNETIGINPIPDPATGTVDIEYSLEEKPSNQITLSGGWGGYQGVVGTLGLVYTNFSARKILKLKEYSPLPSGDGQRLSIQGQANGKRYQNLAVSFTEPWLGGRRPNSLTISLNQSVIRQFSSFGSDASQVGAMHISGANIYLGRRLRKPDNYFQLTNSIGVNKYKVQGTYTIPLVDEGKQYIISNASFNNFNFKTSLARNNINNPTFPRSGSQFTFEVALTPPYSLLRKEGATFNSVMEKYKWVEYHKWSLNFASYSTLSKDKKKRLVLCNKANFGIIGNYNKGLGSGPFERFVLGGTGMQGFGMTSFLLGQDYIGLRGYDDNSPLLNQFAGSNPIGGIAYTKFTSEMRFLVSDNPMATIYGIGFFEAGNNFHSYQSISPYQMRRSIGTGIRLFMPMFGGLLGFDFAFPLDDPAGPQLRTHFSIGQ